MVDSIPIVNSIYIVDPIPPPLFGAIFAKDFAVGLLSHFLLFLSLLPCFVVGDLAGQDAAILSQILYKFGEQFAGFISHREPLLGSFALRKPAQIFDRVEEASAKVGYGAVDGLEYVGPDLVLCASQEGEGFVVSVAVRAPVVGLGGPLLQVYVALEGRGDVLRGHLGRAEQVPQPELVVGLVNWKGPQYFPPHFQFSPLRPTEPFYLSLLRYPWLIFCVLKTSHFLP